MSLSHDQKAAIGAFLDVAVQQGLTRLGTSVAADALVERLRTITEAEWAELQRFHRENKP